MSEGEKPRLESIPIDGIRENPVALRQVNRESEEYIGLIDSIKQVGVLNAITVRPQTDNDTGDSYYELIDGLHRYCAAKDAGLPEIPAQILSLSKAQVMEAQIIANVHKVETRPVEYSKQLKTILSMNPTMTETELAEKLGKSGAWISQRLGLNKIDNPVIQQLINEGKIVLSNAYALAKLPAEEMADFLDRASTLPPDEFLPQVQARLKEIREAKRQGKDASEPEFQQVEFMQKMKDIKTERDELKLAKAIIKKMGAKTPLDGFKAALAWVLHVDPESVAEQRAKWEERKKMREEKKKAREAEKAAKKAEKIKKEAEEAAKAAADANAALKK